jgi:hypothetical protein
MLFRLVAGGFALALLATTVAAEDKKEKDKDKSDVTTWTRDANGVDLTFEFTKDTLKGTVLVGENGFVAKAKITIDKEGVVKAKITDVEEKGKFPDLPKVGTEFSFKWKVTGDKAELSDLKGDEVEQAKAVVEGEYKKKEKGKKD